MDQGDSKFFIVSKDQENQRIDKLLAEQYSNLSRTYFQYLIENSCVLLNNKPIKKRILAKKGDNIHITFIKEPPITISPEKIPLDILYEDSSILAINKPSHMVVHPAPGNWSLTFVNALLFHCKDLEKQDHLRPGIVHRLDKETSGVLIAAKTTLAHQKLIEQFSQREIGKKYLAITIGKPQNIHFSAPIGRHPTKRKEMCVIDRGKEAISDISVLTNNNEFSLVLIKPKTGRTHQIRVHLKHLKKPILGDPIYGQKKMNDKHNALRTLLHCYQMSFTHPITKKNIIITAPIPPDFYQWIKKIDKHFCL